MTDKWDSPYLRPDLAALDARGWQWTQAQADLLAEIANNERISEHDVRSGFEAVTRLVADAPRSGDLIGHVLSRHHAEKAKRLAIAEEAEQAWEDLKQAEGRRAAHMFGERR